MWQLLRQFFAALSTIALIRLYFFRHLLIQIVHFYQSDAGGIVHAAHDSGVVTRRQVCDDRRFASVTGCVAAGLDVANLVGGNNPADDRCCPVVIGGNQRARASCSSNVGLANALGTPY